MQRHQPMHDMPGEAAVTEVIRPAAIVPEDAARAILVELSLRDVRSGGLWLAKAGSWHRYDRPFTDDAPAPGQEPHLIGTVQIAYGIPTLYEITVFRVSVTRFGTEQGWSVHSLCDEVLGFGDIGLADCPRATPHDPDAPSAR